MVNISNIDYVDVSKAPFNAGQGGNDTAAIMSAWAINHKLYFPPGVYHANLNFPEATWLLGANQHNSSGNPGPGSWIVGVNSNPTISISATTPSYGWGVCSLYIASGGGPCLNLTTNGGGLYNGLVENVWLEGGTHAINIDGNVRYNTFRNGDIISSYYGIKTTAGGSGHNVFDDIQIWSVNYMQYIGDDNNYIGSVLGEGFIYAGGNNNQFVNILMETLASRTDTSQSAIVTDRGKNNIWDLYLLDVSRDGLPVIPPYAFQALSPAAGVVLKSLYVLESRGRQSVTYPFGLTSGTEMTIHNIHFYAPNNSPYYSTAESYLTKEQLRNVKIEGGGSFFKNLRKSENFSASAPGGGGTVGDIVWHTDPGAGEYPGWVYTSSGWKGFGQIQA